MQLAFQSGRSPTPIDSRMCSPRPTTPGSGSPRPGARRPRPRRSGAGCRRRAAPCGSLSAGGTGTLRLGLGQRRDPRRLLRRPPPRRVRQGPAGTGTSTKSSRSSVPARGLEQGGHDLQGGGPLRHEELAAVAPAHPPESPLKLGGRPARLELLAGGVLEVEDDPAVVPVRLAPLQARVPHAELKAYASWSGLTRTTRYTVSICRGLGGRSRRKWLPPSASQRRPLGVRPVVGPVGRPGGRLEVAVGDARKSEGPGPAWPLGKRTTEDDSPGGSPEWAS